MTSDRLSELMALVNEQAEDPSLWRLAVDDSEAYLQAALRRLHAAVEHLLDDEGHQIEFGDDGWLIAHPLQERLDGSLFGCGMRVSTMNDPGLRGRFWLHDDGTLGERIET
jgi:hypothetical protein